MPEDEVNRLLLNKIKLEKKQITKGVSMKNLSDNVVRKIQHLKDKTMKIAEKYQKFCKQEIDLVNEITSRQNWADLNTEAQDKLVGQELRALKTENELEIEADIRKLDKEIRDFERTLEVETLKQITQIDELKGFSKKLGITVDTASNLLDIVARTEDIRTIVELSGPVIDMILARQYEKQSGKLIEPARKELKMRLTTDLGQLNAAKQALKLFKGQSQFAQSSFINYGPKEYTNLNIVSMVRKTLDGVK